MGTIRVLSAGIRRIPYLSTFLQADIDSRPAFYKPSSSTVAVAGWGRRATAAKARAYAQQHRVPFIALEDGFLRSMGLGVQGAPPLSLVVDDQGIYYDASVPSRLEQLIHAVSATDQPLKQQAKQAITLIQQHKLSKYNHAPELMLPPLPAQFKSRVLVVDQTVGDVSVKLGGGEEYFQAMLEAALAEKPLAQVVVKTHPDVLSGKKKGYLTQVPALTDPRVLLWAEDCSPMHLLQQVDQVYVFSSQMGFEALMLRKPVVCFGLPWYAGWGLTVDKHPKAAPLTARRYKEPKAVWQLFAAAYVHYARYLHPDTGEQGTIFDVIHWLIRNKRAQQALAGTVYGVGMSRWKQATLTPFLQQPNTRLRFVRSLAQLNRMTLAPDAKLLIWGSRNLQAAQHWAHQKQVPLWRMEDGFVRSVGLGSNLVRPLSLVVDQQGMYYDPNAPSDLEHLLRQGQWSVAQRALATRYQHDFVQQGVSKYNLGGAAVKLHTNKASLQAQQRPILLIPGQVEDDASVQYGSPTVRTNAALIQRVRQHQPHAYILYKPHPDVVAGNRQGHVSARCLQENVDQVVADANIVACLRLADQVHTMSSLTGFEALLHGKQVHCYGGPFYAGWGLTIDYMALPHRQRQLSLAELIYATVFAYPYYVMPPQVGHHGIAAAESVMHYVANYAKKSGTSADRLLARLARVQPKAAALLHMFFSRY